MYRDGYLGMVLCYHCHLVCVPCRPCSAIPTCFWFLRNHFYTCLCHFLIGNHTIYSISCTATAYFLFQVCCFIKGTRIPTYAHLNTLRRAINKLAARAYEELHRGKHRFFAISSRSMIFWLHQHFLIFSPTVNGKAMLSDVGNHPYLLQTKYVPVPMLLARVIKFLGLSPS